MTKKTILPPDFRAIYDAFDAPVADFDCGQKCAPHNEGGKPFCCDICVAIPTAYKTEWDYLISETDLWKAWDAKTCADEDENPAEEVARLKKETPDDMVLIECLGPAECQRDYRALTCRQFPFFPYIDSQGEFLGLSYYWEYEEQCWIISNLDVVNEDYQRQFIQAFELIFEHWPDELETYRIHSEVTRDEYNEKRRAVPLMHRNGHTYKISSHNERLRRVSIESLPKFGPYKITDDLLFPDEVR